MNDDETQSLPQEQNSAEVKNVRILKRMFSGPTRFAVMLIAVLLIAFGLLSLIANRFVGEVTQGSVVTNASSTIVAVDSPAPKFFLPDGQGKIVSLSEFATSPVLILFWASWNSQSMDQVYILNQMNLPPGVRVLAVSTQEDPGKARSAIERGKYSINVVYDENGAVGELFGAKNLPTLFFIDKVGHIRNIAIGVIGESVIMENVEKLL